MILKAWPDVSLSLYHEREDIKSAAGTVAGSRGERRSGGEKRPSMLLSTGPR